MPGTPIKRPRHIIAKIRGLLGVTQKRFARRLQISPHTVMALESHRLELSEKMAHLISMHTGIKATCLIRDEMPDPEPNPAALRARFARMNGVDVEGYWKPKTVMLLRLAKLYALQRALIWELEALGSANFIDSLWDTTLDGLGRLGDDKLARLICVEARKAGAEAIGSVLIADGQELQRAAKNAKKPKSETPASESESPIPFSVRFPGGDERMYELLVKDAAPASSIKETAELTPPSPASPQKESRSLGTEAKGAQDQPSAAPSSANNAARSS